MVEIIKVNKIQIVKLINESSEKREEKLKSHSYHLSWKHFDNEKFCLPNQYYIKNYINFFINDSKFDNKIKDSKYNTTYYLLGRKIRNNLYDMKFLSIDKFEIIAEFKKGDIIKKYRQYYIIDEIIIIKNYKNWFLKFNLKNYVSEEIINFNLTNIQRPMKVYNLGDRVKKRLIKENNEYKEKLKGLITFKERRKVERKSTSFSFNNLNKYRGIRK